MDEWIDYYDSTHTIYASRLHRALHFQVIARDMWNEREGQLTEEPTVGADETPVSETA